MLTHKRCRILSSALRRRLFIQLLSMKRLKLERKKITESCFLRFYLSLISIVSRIDWRQQGAKPFREAMLTKTYKHKNNYIHYYTCISLIQQSTQSIITLLTHKRCRILSYTLGRRLFIQLLSMNRLETGKKMFD